FGAHCGFPTSLLQRSLHFDHTRCVDTDSLLLRRLTCELSDTHQLGDPFDTRVAPSFCVRYHPSHLSSSMMQVEGVANVGSLLAASDEDGWVSSLHSGAPASSQSQAVRHRFQAHQNAIFDLTWVESNLATHSGYFAEPHERTGAVTEQLATVSGDQT